MAEFKENADTLELGIFDEAECLLNSQVSIMLANISSSDDKLPDSFRKALEYVKKVDKFKSLNAVNEVEKLLANNDKLHPFQKATLANLLPETVEEARALIPSLDIEDEDLQHILTNLKTIQNFAGSN